MWCGYHDCKHREIQKDDHIVWEGHTPFHVKCYLEMDLERANVKSYHELHPKER